MTYSRYDIEKGRECRQLTLFSLLFSLFHFPHSFVEVNSWGSEREKRKGMGRREETSELTVPSLRSSTPSIPSSLIASVGW